MARCFCTFAEAPLSLPRLYAAPGLAGVERPRATAKLDNSKPWTGHLQTLDIAA